MVFFGHFVEAAEPAVTSVISFIILLIELYGVFLIIFAVIKEILHGISLHFDCEKMNLNTGFNHALSSALEILMSAEILKTIVAAEVQTMVEIVILVVIRVIMVFVIHWEAKQKGNS